MAEEKKRETHSQFAARLGAEMDAAAQQATVAKGTTATPGKPKEGEGADDTDPGTDEGASADEGTTQRTQATADGEGAQGEGEEEEGAEGMAQGDEGEGEDAGDDAGDEDEGDEGTDEDDQLDRGFQRAAERAKLPISLEDIPEEARPLVKQRLRVMEKGFTRAMMDARRYRAEEKFRAENPVDFISEMLSADPELEEKVSAELEKRRDETYLESRKIITEKRRDDARKAIEEDPRTPEEKRAERGEEVVALTESACTKYGVPFEAVEEAIARLAVAKLKAGSDIDDADIEGIVKSIAKVAGKARREERTEVVKKRLGDRGKGPSIRPGSGRAPTPAAQPGKKLTLKENMERSAKEMFPGAS